MTRQPPPLPGFVTGMSAAARLQWKRTLRGKKLILAAAAVVLVMLAVLIPIMAADLHGTLPDDPDRSLLAGVVQDSYLLGFFFLLIFLVPFLFNSGSIAEEVERRTFAFLAARPISRFSLLLGKFLAGALASLLLIELGILLIHFIAFTKEPSAMIAELPYTLRVMGGSALLVLFYSAVCTVWGTVAPEAAGIVSAAYLALVEFLLTWFPGFLRLPSMNYIARELVGFPQNNLVASFPPPEVPWWAALVTLILATGLALAAGGMLISVREFRYGKA